MPKIVPMDTKQSILEDPSSGSNVTMYLPWKIEKIFEEHPGHFLNSRDYGGAFKQ